MTATPTPDTVAAFLRLLYGEVDLSDERSIAIWTPKRGAMFCCDIDEAVAECDRLNSSGQEAYFAVSLQNEPAARAEARLRAEQRGLDGEAIERKVRSTRGFAETTSVLPGLWLDVDVAGPKHKKTDLPPSLDDAYALVQNLPHSPTVTVETGGGLHAYWLFHEPMAMDTQEDRDEAAAMSYGWQLLARDLAAGRGWNVDSTHDLARVLRPPGTVSQKHGLTIPAPTQVNGRYNPMDFEEWAEAPSKVPAAKIAEQIQVQDGLNPNAQPPMDLFLTMLDLDAAFKRTWDGNRTDLPSQSEYDMALASMAAHAGWKDEDITSLLIAHRRQRNQKLKIDRPAYYAQTLAKARSGVAGAEAHESIQDRLASVEAGTTSIEEEREGILQDLTALTGLRVRRIIKYPGDPPSYRLVLAESSIALPSVESILSPAKFRSAVAACSGDLIGRFKAQRWDPIAQSILRAAEVQDLGADSTVEGVVDEWLDGYLRTSPPLDDRTAAVVSRTPMRLESGVGVFLDSLGQWLQFYRGERHARRELAVRLRTAGVLPKTVSYTREDGARSSVQVWVVPKTESTVSDGYCLGTHDDVQIAD